MTALSTFPRPTFPQRGGCFCGAVRYSLSEDPITLYACHCTDCQTETGVSFTLSMLVAGDSIAVTSGETEAHEYHLPDGRVRRSRRCPNCKVALLCLPRRFPDLLILQPGTLDDTSWLHPVGHIWTRSRQPWVVLPEDSLTYDAQPDDLLALVRAWKERSG